MPVLLAAAPPTPEQYYAQSLAVMRSLPQPAKVAATVSATGDGVGVYIGPAKGPEDAGYALFQGGSQFSATSVSWTETYDSAADSASVNIENAPSLLGIGPLFDPTWNGAYDWLRYGLDGRPHAKPSIAAPTADPNLKTITTLTVMAPGAYRVSDAGAQQCPGGTPGHHLQFASRTDWVRHPLTDITIDERTMRFCSLSFRIDPKHVRGGTGTVQIDYAGTSGFWFETRAHIDFLARMFGIGLHHFGIEVTYHVTKVM